MSVTLSALDGSNPLGFLAALGTLRLLSAEEPALKMRWIREGAWHPELVGIDDVEPIPARLVALAKLNLPLTNFDSLGKNITVDPACFSGFVDQAFRAAMKGNRTLADFAAAFGSEVLPDDKGRIQYTDLCFITGSGHQHFLGTMKGLCEAVSDEHIRDALFGDWKKLKGLSMRWDPSDAAEYAFRWGDPSAEGASSVWGANLLAIHGLPLFPTQPASKGLRTTGFREVYPFPEFTWPIWTHPISLDSVRTLLTLPELHDGITKLIMKSCRQEESRRFTDRREYGLDRAPISKSSFRPARAV